MTDGARIRVLPAGSRKDGMVARAGGAPSQEPSLREVEHPDAVVTAG